MHCIAGVVITFVLLLNWVGIYLYLVIPNKSLANFKNNAQLQPFSLVSLTHHVSSHLWRVHANYSPQLVERWTYVSSLLLSHTPQRSRTGTAGWGAWRMLWWARERFRPSSPSQLWVARSLSPYDVIIYLFCIELLLGAFVLRRSSKHDLTISSKWNVWTDTFGPRLWTWSTIRTKLKLDEGRLRWTGWSPSRTRDGA
jgi:hypothetical protein